LSGISNVATVASFIHIVNAARNHAKIDQEIINKKRSAVVQMHPVSDIISGHLLLRISRTLKAIDRPDDLCDSKSFDIVSAASSGNYFFKKPD
jgi:hypothetical protein